MSFNVFFFTLLQFKPVKKWDVKHTMKFCVVANPSSYYLAQEKIA